MPEYANDSIYKEMENLCSLAGIEVKYTALDDRIWGRTDKYSGIIEMANTDIYDSTERAAKVLGHELAHSIVDNMREHPDGDEIECDRFGEGLYILAEMIALHKTDKVAAELFK